jgi:hypothetical protein
MRVSRFFLNADGFKPVPYLPYTSDITNPEIKKKKETLKEL